MGEVESKNNLLYKHILKINEMQFALLDPGTLSEKLKKITDSVVDIFDADFARIWLMLPGDRCDSGCPHAKVKEGPHMCINRTRCLHLVSSSGRYKHIDGGAHSRVPFGCYKIGGIASGEYPSFLTNEVINDPRVHDHAWAKELGLVSFAGFKLHPPHGETTGVLALFSRHSILPEEYALLESISNVTSRVIQTARVEDARKAAEGKERILLHAIEGAYEACVITDLDGKVTYANKPATELLGYTFEEIIKKDAHTFTSPTEIDKIFESILKYGGWRGETTQLKKNKTSFPAIFSGSLIKDSDGKEIGIIGIFMDITERKKSETDMKDKIHQLEIFQRSMVDREIKMVELKERVRALEKKYGLSS